MEARPQATSAVRLVDHWYKEFIAEVVDELRAMEDTSIALTGALLARAHEMTWRKGIVRAAREADPADWAALTVAHEAAVYEHLLGWLAATYAVDEAEIRANQTSRGYRHQPR